MHNNKSHGFTTFHYSLLASAIDFGTDLPTFPVLTGPGIVDASNIEATLAGVALGAR